MPTLFTTIFQPPLLGRRMYAALGSAHHTTCASETVRLPRLKMLAARIPQRLIDMAQSGGEGEGGEQREIEDEIKER
jgi:hypothetical protein